MTTTTEGAAGGEAGGGEAKAAAAGAAELLLQEAGGAAGGADGGDGKAGADGGAGGDDGQRDGVPWWQGDGLKVSNAKPEGGEGLSDAEWLDNKKYSSLPEMIKAMRGLESQIGREKIVLPKGPDDKAGWDAALKALGRPDAPDGYELNLPEGFDPKLVESYKAKAHEIGLLPAQTQALVEWLEGQDNSTAAENASAAATELKAEWRDGYKANMELVRRGSAALGIDPGAMNQMAVGYGLANVMRLMAAAGRGLGEAGTMGGDGTGTSGGMTAEQATARKAEIVKDRELVAKLLNGTAPRSAMDEWNRIAEVEAAAMERRRAG
jgi:hypothetical protein